MRVLFVAENYPNNIQPASGGDIHSQARALLAQGVEVRVLAPIPWVPVKGSFRGWPAYSQVNAADEIDGVPIIHPRYLTPPRPIRVDYWRIALPLQYAPILAKMRKTFPFDLIHGQNLFPEGYVALRLAKKFGVPSMVHSRGSDAVYWPHNLRRYRRFAEKVIQSADQLLTICHAQRRVVEALAQPKAICEVVYNGVDPTRYDANPELRNQLRQQLNLGPNNLLLAFVGELRTNKGIAELLEAFETIAAMHNHCQLLMIGGGSEAEQWYQAADNLKARSRLRFAGYVSPPEVANWLSAADIFVFPSHREGLPNAVLEAAAVGLPIVATNCGGIPEIIQDGINGLLVSPQDTKELICALERMISQPDLRARFSARVRADTLQKFSWDAHGKRLREVYERVLAATP